jgi:HTH-type transcriptional regulator / antitoxin HigA
MNGGIRMDNGVKVESAVTRPNWATHPGEHLAEYIETNGWSQAEFSRLAGLTPKLISTILTGDNPVTPETALRLERVLGVKAYIWTNLQSKWDLNEAQKAEQKYLNQAREWISRFPVKELKVQRIIPDRSDDWEVLGALLSFLGIGRPSSLDSKLASLAVNHRRAKGYDSSDEHVLTWLMLAEKKARSRQLPAFDRDGFAAAVKSIRALTTKGPAEFEPQMIELCRKAGVALIFEKPIGKTRLFGSARWLSGGNAIIQMSLRMKSNDHFWWTFFHECGHILLHHGKNFADDQNGAGDGLEDKADEFAKEVLVGRKHYADFLETKPKTKIEVKEFAAQRSVHPGIVVGMLQHHKVIPFTHMNDLKVRFEWAD